MSDQRLLPKGTNVPFSRHYLLSEDTSLHVPDYYYFSLHQPLDALRHNLFLFVCFPLQFVVLHNLSLPTARTSDSHFENLENHSVLKGSWWLIHVCGVVPMIWNLASESSSQMRTSQSHFLLALHFHSRSLVMWATSCCRGQQQLLPCTTICWIEFGSYVVPLTGIGWMSYSTDPVADVDIISSLFVCDVTHVTVLSD